MNSYRMICANCGDDFVYYPYSSVNRNHCVNCYWIVVYNNLQIDIPSYLRTARKTKITKRQFYNCEIVEE